MFQRILIPLDGSSLAECVLPHAVAVARPNNAEIMLLRVLDPVGAATRPRHVDPLDWQIRKAEAESYLKGLAARFEAAGIKAEMVVLEGNAAESVIESAQAHEVNLIILSSHGQSGISGWNVSSVVQKVIMRARTSVMIVRAYRPVTEAITEYRYQRILIPLDGSQRAECVLPYAMAIARYHNAKLLVAHVVEKPEMPRRTPPTEEDIDLAARLVERNRVEISKYLEELKSHLEVQVEMLLLVGEHVAASLHDLVEERESDLVILSAHGYSGETKWPYGSTVTSFITYGTSSLLIWQDLPVDRIEPTQAEIAAREHGGR
jgi:nucleotide-binding universal stress UspA family protein